MPYGGCVLFACDSRNYFILQNVVACDNVLKWWIQLKDLKNSCDPEYFLMCSSLEEIWL